MMMVTVRPADGFGQVLNIGQRIVLGSILKIRGKLVQFRCLGVLPFAVAVWAAFCRLVAICAVTC